MSIEPSTVTGRIPDVARPTTVRYNDWPKVDSSPLETFEPAYPLSVIVPCFEAPGKLALTLAALEGQTYPRELFEVIVVDDASDPPLILPSTLLDLKLIRQEGTGFGAARARNNGARAAANEILVFIDGDVMAEAELLSAHARWHHVLSDAMTLGLYRRVSVDDLSAELIRDGSRSLAGLLEDRESDPSPLLGHLDKTSNFTARRDDLFRAASSGNLGVRKRFFDQIGGFDESFTRYGGEDTEFAFRAYTHGALLVPVLEAMAWHQGRLDDSRVKQDSAEIQRGGAANLIAHPKYRPEARGRSFTVPEYVVTVRSGQETRDRVLAVTEAILGGEIHDLVVRIEMPLYRDDDVAWIASRLKDDPRVRLAESQSALDQFPASPFHVVVDAGADFDRRLINRLREGLGLAVEARTPPSMSAHMSITRTWALRRAQRNGSDVDRFGDVVTIDWQSRAARMRQWLQRICRLVGVAANENRAGWKHVLRRAVRVRRARNLKTFLEWFLRGVSGRTFEAFGGRRARKSRYSPPPAVARDPTPLDVEIVTLGPQAARVFAVCPFVGNSLDGGHLDFVVADTLSEAAVCEAPAVVLAESPPLAVPAFDPTVHNPMGWERDVEDIVGALGPRHLLPPGIKADFVVSPTDMETIRRCHHLVDVAGFHANVIERAGALVRLAATGAPVYLADGGPKLRQLIGAELQTLMTKRVREADADERELLSIKIRRIALREHSLRSRVRQMSESVLDDPPRLPCVSILLATKRPDFLRWATENVARQNYPRLQLVLALHGEGFEEDEVDRCVGSVNVPVRVVRVGSHRAFGSVLNAATQEANGTLLTKMDDDDLYGSDHIWDLVLAHEYSGAQLVGKALETVYLAHRDETVQRFRRQGETFNRHLAGGTLLISRHDLDRVGGWQRVRSGLDLALIDSVIRANGIVYRTHGSGYVMVRRHQGHTWEASDDEFLERSYAVVPGWRPGLADIEKVPDLPITTE